MEREEFKRTLDQVRPSPEREKAMLAAVLSGESGARKGRRWSRLATVGLAAALCAMLAITALAVSPTLREALQNALGLFQPYSQEVEGISVVDQGIEVEVVSALSDGNDTWVYYEVRDLTADRLDGFLYDNLNVAPTNLEDTSWASVGGGSEGVVQYDSSTRTALCIARLVGTGAPAEALTLAFDIAKINPGYHREQMNVDLEWIAQETLRTETTEKGKVVLVPNQNPGPLGSEYLSISSFGFGEDGVLHLQFKVEGDASQWDWEECSIGIAAHSRSDTTRTTRYNGWDRGITGMTDEEVELTDPRTRFEREGVVYWDVRTGITPADVAEGDVELEAYDFLATCPPIQGKWSLNIPVELTEPLSVDMTPSQTVLGEVTVKSLHLSVLGCTIESSFEGEKSGHLNDSLTLYLADGRVVADEEASHWASARLRERYVVDRWLFDRPVDPSEVTAIAIGQWYIPIENGVAQPGHWLEEMP